MNSKVKPNSNKVFPPSTKSTVTLAMQLKRDLLMRCVPSSSTAVCGINKWDPNSCVEKDVGWGGVWGSEGGVDGGGGRSHFVP